MSAGEPSRGLAVTPLADGWSHVSVRGLGSVEVPPGVEVLPSDDPLGFPVAALPGGLHVWVSAWPDAVIYRDGEADSFRWPAVYDIYEGHRTAHDPGHSDGHFLVGSALGVLREWAYVVAARLRAMGRAPEVTAPEFSWPEAQDAGSLRPAVHSETESA